MKFFLIIFIVLIDTITFQAQLLETGKKYNLKHHSGLYLTLGPDDDWQMFSIEKLVPGDSTQQFTLQPIGSTDTFNIIAADGRYLTLNSKNTWDCIAGTDPALVRAQFRILSVEAEDSKFFRIQDLTKESGTDQYLGVDAITPGSFTYLDKPGNDNSLWQFVEAASTPEKIELEHVFPDYDAVDVSNLMNITATFNSVITLLDGSGITIVDAAGTDVEGISVTFNKTELSIAHNPLAYGATYTITIPEGTIKDYDQTISWTYTTAIPVTPKEPLSYNIINTTTGYYLTLPETEPANDSKFSVSSKIEGEEYKRQIFKFLNPDPEKEDTFNIAVFTNEYMTKVSGSNWAMNKSDDPSALEAQFIIIPDGINIKIQALAHAGTGMFLGPDNLNENVACYLDKTENISWRLEPVNYPISIFKTSPANGAINVSLTSAVTATLTQPVTSADLSSITITDPEGNSVTDVLASLNDNIINIAHADFNYSTTYTVTIPKEAITNLEDTLSWSFSSIPTPEVTSTIPADGTTNVSVDVPIKVLYNGEIEVESLDGVTITDAEGNAVVDVTTTFSGGILEFSNPLLVYGSTYTVTIPAGTISGIDDSFLWSFTTATAPVCLSTTPADGATDIPPTTSINVTFDKQIHAESLSSITITDSDGNHVVAVSSLSSAKLTIVTNGLLNNTLYTVTIPANTIYGVTEDIVFAFTTSSGMVGVSDVNECCETSVFPTITEGCVTVRANAETTVWITNINGIYLDQYKLNGAMTINLNYPNGVYFIIIEKLDNRFSSHKVILNR